MGRKKRPKIETAQPGLEQPAVQVPAANPPAVTSKGGPAAPDFRFMCIPVNDSGPSQPPPVMEQKVPPESVLFGRDADEQTESRKNKSISFDPRIKNENNDAPPPPSNTIATATTAVVEKESSAYGMHSHSGDLIEEHIYVSDGSDDEFNFNTGKEDDENNKSDGGEDKSNETTLKGEKDDGLELVLTGSKMGLMRRGLAAQLFQPKTWVRQQAGNDSSALSSGSNGQNVSSTEDGDGITKGDSEEAGDQIQSETPAQKAAQLLAAKKQKEEELKQMKRTLESSENAGRDPCLFSKRTAFDIRMDQIEDKPWDRSSGGTADITDYFNYGLSEEDWLEYSDRQLTVRQELTDASRQRRSADPTIVPVVPKTPSKQTPKVAVAVKKEKKKNPEEDVKIEDENAAVQGPSIPKEMAVQIKKEEDNDNDTKSDHDTVSSKQSSKSVEGGVWGIDVQPGSTLAKLIEEQERNANKSSGKDGPPPPPPPPPPLPMHQQNMNMHSDQHGGYQSTHFQQNEKGPPPPPPPSFQDQYFPPQHHPPPGQYHRGNAYGRGQYHQGRGGPQMSQHGQFHHDQSGSRGHHFGGRGNQYGGRGDFGGRGRGRGGRGGHWGNGPQQGQQYSGGRGGRSGGRGYMRDDWHRR